METDQKLMKFVCKFCNKRYPCGKSLGGHLRSHKISINLAAADELDCDTARINSKRELDYEVVGESSSYGLRMNPKKTRRYGDLTHVVLQEQQQGCSSNVCKECGKGFQSMKALCGHMACHSEKDKAASDCNWSEEDVSDSETSEIEQDEQEELAKCLMMLSRDNWVSGSKSPKSDPVVLETKSSPVRVRIRAVEMKPKSADESSLCKKSGSGSGSGFSRYEELEDPDMIKNNNLNKHECPVCGRLFDTRKALAGHISASSCRKNINREEQMWKNETRVSKNSLGAKKSYKHECPICFRIFRSGQALGGHKRSHFLGANSEDRSTVIVEQDIVNEVPTLIDLNFPAPPEDEANGECGIVFC